MNKGRQKQIGSEAALDRLFSCVDDSEGDGEQTRNVEIEQQHQGKISSSSTTTKESVAVLSKGTSSSNQVSRKQGRDTYLTQVQMPFSTERQEVYVFRVNGEEVQQGSTQKDERVNQTEHLYNKNVESPELKRVEQVNGKEHSTDVQDQEGDVQSPDRKKRKGVDAEEHIEVNQTAAITKLSKNKRRKLKKKKRKQFIKAHSEEASTKGSSSKTMKHLSKTFVYMPETKREGEGAIDLHEPNPLREHKTDELEEYGDPDAQMPQIQQKQDQGTLFLFQQTLM